MERIRLMSLAAVMSLAATLATAASLPDANALKARFFSGAPAVDAPPLAPVQAAPVAPAGGVTAAAYTEPDWAFTPGRLCTATDPDFKEYRYAEHIPYCNRNVTQQMKQQVAAHYGVPQSEWSNYEFDHLIPLAIGGDSHVDNLWPEPNSQNQGNAGKDHLELELYLQMKAGTLSQADAVKQIYAWFKTAHPIQAAQMGL